MMRAVVDSISLPELPVLIEACAVHKNVNRPMFEETLELMLPLSEQSTRNDDEVREMWNFAQVLEEW